MGQVGKLGYFGVRFRTKKYAVSYFSAESEAIALRPTEKGGRRKNAELVGYSRFVHLTAENQLHLFGSAQIDILPDDLLKKAAPAHGLVPDLSERKLRLCNMLRS